MTREQAEVAIRHLLATETSAVRLSNTLFQQWTGLFAHLWTTAEERRAVVQSPLFDEASRRVTELMYREAFAPRAIS